MDIGTINSPFNYTSNLPTLLGVNYKLIVEGTYGLEFFNSNHKDRLFLSLQLVILLMIGRWTDCQFVRILIYIIQT